MIDLQTLQEVHKDCGCLTFCDMSGKDEHTFKHDGCTLRVQGFRLRINCDVCKAFAPSGMRPDLLVLRSKDARSEWLVVEIKNKMDIRAISQVNAGFNVLRENDLFKDFKTDVARGLLAYKRANKIRTADLDRLRKSMRYNGRPVTIHPPRQCGRISV